MIIHWEQTGKNIEYWKNFSRSYVGEHTAISEVGIKRGCEVIRGINKNPPLGGFLLWISLVSKERIKYHPPCKDPQQKSSTKEDSLWARRGSNIILPMRTRNKNPPQGRILYERGGDRTLNKRLKRPLLCHWATRPSIGLCPKWVKAKGILTWVGGSVNKTRRVSPWGSTSVMHPARLTFFLRKTPP